jgi:hypothetical protein
MPTAQTIAPEVTRTAAPLAADERIHALDILRGLALFCDPGALHQKMRLEVSGPRT